MNTATVTTHPTHDNYAEGISKMSKNEIFLEIRRRICLLDYQPGCRLNERELAAEFGVSRTPLRSVLQRLEADGLIVSQHGNGTEVTHIDLPSIKDIYLVRMHLMDAMMASTHLPITDGLLAEFKELEAACAILRTETDRRKFAQLNISMHVILHGLTNNLPLKNMNDILFYQSARFWFLLLERMDYAEQVDDLVNELKMLRTAFELRDVRLVAAIHKAHLAIVVSRLEAIDLGSA